MSEPKQEQLGRTVQAINVLDEAGCERLATLAEGMAIQKSLATNEKKGDEKNHKNEEE